MDIDNIMKDVQAVKAFIAEAGPLLPIIKQIAADPDLLAKVAEASGDFSKAAADFQDLSERVRTLEKETLSDKPADAPSLQLRVAALENDPMREWPKTHEARGNLEKQISHMIGEQPQPSLEATGEKVVEEVEQAAQDQAQQQNPNPPQGGRSAEGTTEGTA